MNKCRLCKKEILPCDVNINPNFHIDCAKKVMKDFFENIDTEIVFVKETDCKVENPSGCSTAQHDPINRPKHYNNSPAICECGRRIECIDVTRHMNFNIGNAVKYLWRFQDKSGLEDLKKARWYLDDAIKKMEAKSAPDPECDFQKTARLIIDKHKGAIVGLSDK